MDSEEYVIAGQAELLAPTRQDAEFVLTPPRLDDGRVRMLKRDGRVRRSFPCMSPRLKLKDRELDILKLLAEGLSDRAIAARLNLSTETVRWYDKQIYLKLGVTSRGEAAARAIALGIISKVEPSSPRPPVDRSPIRYVNNEGISIAYQVVGKGSVDLLFMSGFVSHLEISWEEPGYAAFFEELGRHARVIIFDKRGVGLSDRIRGASTLENTISDSRCVMRAVGSTRAFVCGTSESGAAAVLLASMYPDLVRGLVLMAATPMPARRGAEPEWARPWEEFERNIELMQQTWGEPWAIERFAPSRKGDAAFEGWWSRALRSASSPMSVRLILEQAMQVDIRTLLPQVRTRTLIVHRTGDSVVNVGAARYLAARMPNASLVELPGADHLYFVNPQQIAQAIVRFLAEPDVEPEIATWIAIVLQSAGPGALLNDEKRGILDAMEARQVRSTPNGWAALFDAPNRAIRCAERLRELGRGRVGGMALHVGACRTIDGAPVGAAHEIALRLVESAVPGEVLVSGTLRDILAGSDVALVARSIDGGDAVTPPMTVWKLASKSS
jgi:pimeloyl-ACP methyl ester carboxylesterase/DNA-binding CsgD family transcriptional regulator